MKNFHRSAGPRPLPADTPGTSPAATKAQATASFNDFAASLLFAQHVAGYAGNSAENRGKDAGCAVWPMTELQELLDEWIIHWQNRPHDGLSHPLMPGRALTPNEAYAALVEVAGYAPVPLSEHDYVELLPATWRVVNSYGVKVGHRRYDCRALNPYRRQHSRPEPSRQLIFAIKSDGRER